MRLIIPVVVVAALAVTASSAVAQSLADVARQEEARRKAIASSGKVYTNENLDSQPAPQGTAQSAGQPAQPAAPTTPAAPATPAAPGVPGAPGSNAQPSTQTSTTPKTEAEWRKRMADERDALSRAQIFVEALQTRINALSTDFVNTDDPAKRDVVAAERQKSLAEMDRVKQEIQAHQKAITDLQTEARRAGVPAGWVR
jgi:hypothetical protein